MNKRAPFLAAALSLAPFIPPSASAAIVFQDDFDSGLSGGSWVVNRGSTNGSFDSFVDHAFNYSSLGIPSAPNSIGGSTFGMRFLVNQSAGIFQGISSSPFDKSFTGDFVIRFDLWMNFVGPAPLGGSGSTQSSSFGWGTSGTIAQWADSKHSVMFAATIDGNSSQDYRAYLRELAPSAGATAPPESGVYAAGNVASPDPRNHNHEYYSGFGGITPPQAQTDLYASQSGTTLVGSLGFSWHEVAILKSGDEVSWFVDDLRIATVPITGATLGGDNIFFGMFDTNATSSNDPNDFLNTVIYDNISVEIIPEPASLGLCGAAATALLLRRRRR